MIHSILTDDKKLPTVLKKHIVPENNIHSTLQVTKNVSRNQSSLMKFNVTKDWNNLPQSIIHQKACGDF